MPLDPYAILGVSRDASPEDIKKAYRSLSKEWHPDKHKGKKDAEQKFKEINQAYEIVSDPEKRKMYDQFGSTGGQAGGQGFDFSSFGNGAGMGDFADIFENFFGGRTASRARENGQDMEVEIVLDLADVLEDVQKAIRLRAFVACETCGGKGLAEGARMETCKQCGGTGQVTRTAQSFFGQIQQRVLCDACGGAGKEPSERCSTCKGEGRTRGEREVTISVPAGIADGQSLRIRSEGEAGRRGAPSGDLFVRVRVRPAPRFERDGADIRCAKRIPAIDAILGADAEVETLHGSVTLHIPEGTQPGQVLRMKGKGLPVLGRHSHGDHYVSIEVEIPKKLSREERRILEEWRKTKG